MLKYWIRYSTVEAGRTHSSESQFQEDLLRQRINFVKERDQLTIETMAKAIGVPHASFKKLANGEDGGLATCCKPTLRWLDSVDKDWLSRMEVAAKEAQDKPREKQSESDKLLLGFLRMPRQKGEKIRGRRSRERKREVGEKRSGNEDIGTDVHGVTVGFGCIAGSNITANRHKKQKIASSNASSTPSLPSFSRRQVAMDNLVKYIAKNPNVPIYKTRDLVRRLNNQSSDLSSIILVDVRTPEERQVSFIPHSISTDEFEALNHEEIKKNDVDIVAYCTLGMRSGNFAQNLIKNRGFRRVYNGEGIIMWSHDSGGLPFVCESKEKKGELESTMKVHCFGSEWEKMLNIDGKYEGVVFNSTNFFWHGIRAMFGF